MTDLGTVPVASGSATVNLAVPAGAAAGTGTLVLTAVETGPVVTAGVQVATDGPVLPVCTARAKPAQWYDVLGCIRYGAAWLQYQQCLPG